MKRLAPLALLVTACTGSSSADPADATVSYAARSAIVVQ
jgi:hypothetical protein